MTRTDFDVIQIGYGPVSKVSALMLDRLGWKVGVFERHGELYPLPRAVCIDHEVSRVLHAAGLGEIADAATSAPPVYRWFNAAWEELLAIDWTEESISGGPGVLFVHQLFSPRIPRLLLWTFGALALASPWFALRPAASCLSTTITTSTTTCSPVYRRHIGTA